MIKILLFTFLLGLNTKTHAKVTRTYFLKVSGNVELANKLITDLSEKECFTLSYVEKSPKDEGECHAFRKFENKDIGDHFLYVITIENPRKFNLQIYKKDGKDLRLVVNAGDFHPARDFYKNLLFTTIRLTFK